MYLENLEKIHNVVVNSMRDTIRKLETSLKYSRDLEAIRFLRYSTSKSRNKIITDDLKRSNIRNKEMLNLFRQSVTDVQLSSIDMLPEILKRQVQRKWHQKYDALLLQNEKLKKQIISMERIMKEKQKEINTLQQRLLDVAGNIIDHEGNTKRICRRCWILRNKI